MDAIVFPTTVAIAFERFVPLEEHEATTGAIGIERLGDWWDATLISGRAVFLNGSLCEFLIANCTVT